MTEQLELFDGFIVETSEFTLKSVHEILEIMELIVAFNSEIVSELTNLYMKQIIDQINFDEIERDLYQNEKELCREIETWFKGLESLNHATIVFAHDHDDMERQRELLKLKYTHVY